MMTITEIAKKLKLPRATAYGLIHAFEEMGVLTPVGRVVNGERGKPASLYHVTTEDLAALTKVFEPLFTAQTQKAVKAATQAAEAAQREAQKAVETAQREADKAQAEADAAVARAKALAAKIPTVTAQTA